MMIRRVFVCAAVATAWLILLPMKAKADFRLCNDLRVPTFSAITYEDKSKGPVSVGWFEVPRLSCEKLIVGSLKASVAYHMVLWPSASGSWWSPRPDDEGFCVAQHEPRAPSSKQPGPFAIYQNDLKGSSCQAAGYVERGFRKLQSGTDDATWVFDSMAALPAAVEKELAPNEYFKECNGLQPWWTHTWHPCPRMMVVPAGELMVGSPDDEPGRGAQEGPLHKVTIRQPFALADRWITRAQYRDFVEKAGYDAGNNCKVWKDGKWSEEPGRSFRNPGFAQSDDDPAVCVSYEDAKAYVAWLSKQNGRAYRLPSEAEWEYAIRAGSTTPFWWGPAITTAQANYNGNLTYAGGAKGDFRQRTVASGFRANTWDIYGAGNVAEWTEDCWAETYQGAPADGSARSNGNCAMRAVRGGSWASDPARLRSAARAGMESMIRMNDVGFRVARTLAR